MLPEGIPVTGFKSIVLNTNWEKQGQNIKTQRQDSLVLKYY